jgi:pyruvate ferredoxin oxidoreductase beta subunit
MEDGAITKVRKIKDRKPVEEYLKAQGRFRHLFRKEGGAEQIAKIQAIADANARRYGLDG